MFYSHFDLAQTVSLELLLDARSKNEDFTSVSLKYRQATQWTDTMMWSATCVTCCRRRRGDFVCILCLLLSDKRDMKGHTSVFFSDSPLHKRQK